MMVKVRQKKKQKSYKKHIPLSCVNPSLNTLVYKNIFKLYDIVSIPNFLQSDFAEKYYKFLTKDMTDEWWYLSAFCGDNTEKVILHNNDENKTEIQDIKIQANDKFVEDEFSYAFYRTYKNHFPECDCQECQFRKVVNSPEFILLMNQITGLQLEKNNELFISKFNEGCFLNVHNDKGNGKIAIVLNMTKNWKPQYGGNFYLLSKDRTSIRKTIVPSFNSLTIFKIPEPNGVPHYVSHVVPNLKQERIAISGWFS